MKKLVLIVSMFSVLAASHSALACANSDADRNKNTKVIKSVVGDALGGTSRGSTS